MQSAPQSAPKVDRGAVREAPSPGRPNGLTPPAERGKGSPRTPPRRALAVGPDPHFTIRRGLEKAREEQELLDQLRWVRPKPFLPAVPPSLVWCPECVSDRCVYRILKGCLFISTG